MKIVIKNTRRDKSEFFQIATWFMDDFYVFNTHRKYETRNDACIAERNREMKKIVKTETAFS